MKDGDVAESGVSHPVRLGRRALLRMALAGTGVLLLPSQRAAMRVGALGPVGNLLPPDRNGWRLPAGFSSRIVAVSNQVVADSGFTWHRDPDGGAVFADADGGWRYVSNSERKDGKGGVGMLRFDADGTVTGGAQLLSGSTMNCAGGATPWGTWLSCEEHPTGVVWEVDPTGVAPPVAHDAMGRFQHEAATADVDRQVFYLTEDRPDGLFYRFRPATWGDLSSGVLEALAENEDGLRWAAVADPSGDPVRTHRQVPDAVRFDGGEGVWYAENEVFFTTKGDNRVWSLGLDPLALRVVYDRTTHPNPELGGVDNLIMAPNGALLIVEDGDDLQIVSLTTAGELEVFAQLTGVSGTELTGISFDPAGRRLYVSSQRNPGVTYEIAGPFPRPGGVDQPAPGPPVDGTPEVTYSGTWFRWVDASQTDGSAMVGRRVGSSARVSFIGSSLRWTGQTGPDRATAEVVVDGRSVATIDTYSQTYTSRQVLFDVTDLEQASHVVEIVLSGFNAAATGWPALVIDVIDTSGDF